MQLVMLGLPGAGKGTQAARIQQEFAIPHISTGDMFRAAISAETELGATVKSFLDRGILVPDEVTIAVVKERLNASDTANGFLLDGFPRTLQQAMALDETLIDLNKGLSGVLYIHVPEGVLLARLTGRRICKQCGATFHVVFQPPQREGVCDRCGGVLYQRSDDTGEAVSTRLEQYAQTAPLVEYYRDRGLLRQVDGEQSIDQVFAGIHEILGHLQG
ncbi:adenylate kinase [Alicyclobacillaceae bacterium I2511]|nr:adenylate kinase [Alicyclobacillaceae bacterium I2511]